jgi:hypothetical protein
MAKYSGSDFSIDLPDGAINATVHAFAFPQGGLHTPTLFIRSEHPHSPVPLSDYVDSQVALLQAAKEALDVVRRRTGVWHGRDALDLLVDFGPPEQRLRQRLVYLDAKGEPQTIYILAATDTAETFDGNEAMFNAAILSFLPQPAD